MISKTTTIKDILQNETDRLAQWRAERQADADRLRELAAQGYALGRCPQLAHTVQEAGAILHRRLNRDGAPAFRRWLKKAVHMDYSTADFYIGIYRRSPAHLHRN